MEEKLAVEVYRRLFHHNVAEETVIASWKYERSKVKSEGSRELRRTGFKKITTGLQSLSIEKDY